MDRGAWQATVHGVTKIKHDLATTTHLCSSEEELATFTFCLDMSLNHPLVLKMKKSAAELVLKLSFETCLNIDGHNELS